MKHAVSKTLLALAALAAAVPPAFAQTRATQAERLARYMRYAGAPVDQFEFWQLDHYELVGPLKVVVFPTINTAYLLTVADPCPGLEWSNGIGVTSQESHYVTRRLDDVTDGSGLRCEIEEIQPIDYKQMLKDGPDGAPST